MMKGCSNRGVGNDLLRSFAGVLLPFWNPFCGVLHMCVFHPPWVHLPYTNVNLTVPQLCKNFEVESLRSFEKPSLSFLCPINLHYEFKYQSLEKKGATQHVCYNWASLWYKNKQCLFILTIYFSFDF